MTAALRLAGLVVELGKRPKPPPKYRILVMMASNLPEALDPALLKAIGLILIELLLVTAVAAFAPARRAAARWKPRLRRPRTAPRRP